MKTAAKKKVEANASPGIIDRIKSHQDALDFKGETLEEFEHRTERDTPGQKAGKRLEDIAFALREGKPLGKTERWYYPWFERKVGSGVGLRFSAYVCDGDDATVGSRLCVDTSEKAIYMGCEFTADWAQYIYEQ